MANADPRIKPESLESDVQDMNLKEEHGDVEMESIPDVHSTKGDNSTAGIERSKGTATPKGLKSQSRSPIKSEAMLHSPAVKTEEEVVGGDIELKIEPGKPLKLQRKSSHKVERRPPPLFTDYDDKTREATSTFAVMNDCTYANKHLGTTEHALECDCAEEWGRSSLIYPFTNCP